jgi:hypothetical protein
LIKVSSTIYSRIFLFLACIFRGLLLNPIPNGNGISFK